MQRQYQALSARVRAGRLGAGLLLWVDAFDWTGRVRDEAQRLRVIRERADWVRTSLAEAQSRVRVEYLPMFHPNEAVSLPNGSLPVAPEG
jgi:hypothetical protein